MGEPGVRSVRPAPLSYRILIAVALAVAVIFAVGVPPASAEDPDIVIDVIDGESPNPSPSPSDPGGGGGGGGGSTPTPSPTSGSTPTPSSTPPGAALALAVSGLQVETRPSANPFGGSVVLRVTVRNHSAETLDLTARFWVDNVVGMRLANSSDIAVKGLAPGDERTVRTELSGMGQNVLVHAFARITPPEKIGGVDQKPIQRDTWSIVVAWVPAALLLCAAVAFAIRFWMRRGGL